MYEANLGRQIAQSRAIKATTEEQSGRRARLPDLTDELSPRDTDALLSQSAVRRRRRRERGLKAGFQDNSADLFRPFRIY